MAECDENFNEFIEKLKTGDEKAWNCFNKKYGKLINKKIKDFPKFQNIKLEENETLDLFQEILITILKGLRDFHNEYGKPSFIAWLKTIIYTRTYNFKEKKNLEQEKINSNPDVLENRIDERTNNTHEEIICALKDCFEIAFHNDRNNEGLIKKQILYFLCDGKRPREIREALELTENQYEYQRDLAFQIIKDNCKDLEDFFRKN